ncbi:hypothetical protein [Modicisalibacter xianhensis]|uniref:hypothetical protein n=1 Tax=Modicisalibacter xianhensis TaxID=442341 RepID=UPI001062E20D|nr:hypothetical protein [Halomonas xianhensis]
MLPQGPLVDCGGKIFSTIFFVGSAVTLILSLLFTIVATFYGFKGEVLGVGGVVVTASLVVAWLCLDEVRAVNAAVRLVGGWPNVKHKNGAAEAEICIESVSRVPVEGNL